jgi:hypothetical protein
MGAMPPPRQPDVDEDQREDSEERVQHVERRDLGERALADDPEREAGSACSGAIT